MFDVYEIETINNKIELLSSLKQWQNNSEN